MSYIPKIDFILKFKEGDYLIASGTPYFMPKGDTSKAYLGDGERKELMGKICHSLKSEAVGPFTLTYEVEDGALVSACLVTASHRSEGKLADAAEVKKRNADVQNGMLKLKEPRPPYIRRAAQFGDGRVLLLVKNLTGEERHVLFVGTPGQMEMVRLRDGMQDGSSFFHTAAPPSFDYTAENGKKVELPYGGETPQYGEEFLSYIDIKDKKDFSAFGIAVKKDDPHLDPFMPESNAKKPTSSARPAFRR